MSPSTKLKSDDQIWRTISLQEDFLSKYQWEKEKHPSRKNGKGNKGSFHAHAWTQIEMMSRHMKNVNLLITQEM